MAPIRDVFKTAADGPQGEDPYGEADKRTAARAAAVIWSVILALLLLMLPLSPPNDAIGEAGWAIAGAIAVVGAFLVRWLWRPGAELSIRGQLLIAYGSVVALAVIQWLAGGVEPPYEEAMVLPLLFVAALHSAERLALFGCWVALGLTAPLLYDSLEHRAEADSLVTFVIWCGLALITYIVMAAARRQRLQLVRESLRAREEARVDALTDLGNRRAFIETISREVERARRSGQPLSIAMLDIVNFKGINDEWGHLEGDNVLKDVARTLRNAARRPDLCFRWGGDEFALLLPNTNAEGGQHLGERLAERVARSCMRPEGEPVQLRVGIADLTHDADINEFLDAAGLALHAARAETAAEADRA